MPAAFLLWIWIRHSMWLSSVLFYGFLINPFLFSVFSMKIMVLSFLNTWMIHPTSRIGMWRFRTSRRRPRCSRIRFLLLKRSCVAWNGWVGWHYPATLWIISLSDLQHGHWTELADLEDHRLFTQLNLLSCNVLPFGMKSKLSALFLPVLRDFAMYLFLLSFLGVGAAGAWPQYGGQREVTSLDGQWLFGFNASKDFDVLQEGRREDGGSPQMRNVDL